jgi:hypothetical protein
MPIDPREIDVVVQGPVTGTPADPPEKQLSRACLESLRCHLPGSRLILSTWEGSDRTGLDYDRFVTSSDPGAPSYWKSYPVPYNLNRQIVSTRTGMNLAERRFILKIRSDLVLTGTGFLDLWQRFPVRHPEWRVFENRLVASAWPTVNPRRSPLPFALSDWFHFGLREDVMRLWDRPPATDDDARYFETHPRPTPDKLPDLLCRYNPEQAVWLGCLRGHGPVPCEHIWDRGPHNRELAELTLVNNVILAEPVRLGVEFRKYDFRTTGIYNYYTHAEWLDLYRRYCDRSFLLTAGDQFALWRDRLTLWPRLLAARVWSRVRARVSRRLS